MTLKQAIKILDELAHDIGPYPMSEEVEAIELGIEALKQMKAERITYRFMRHWRMLGETEE